MTFMRGFEVPKGIGDLKKQQKGCADDRDLVPA